MRGGGQVHRPKRELPPPPLLSMILWTFAIACCVTGSVMIAYAIKILHDAITD
jgi:hypothetical protein